MKVSNYKTVPRPLTHFPIELLPISISILSRSKEEGRRGKG
jgi:hypothetical protein